MVNPIYRTKRWRETRLRVIERDNWRCVACGKSGKLEVDHITPLSKHGAEYAFDNLQSLCKKCHIAKTKRETSQRESSAEVVEWLDYREMLEYQSIRFRLR